MKPFSSVALVCVLLITVLLHGASLAEDPLMQAVQVYRSGRYAEAQKQFSALHAAQPEDVRAAYYLALSEAQLGRFEQARRLYQQVLLLDPNGEAAALARQGLQYLPSDSAGLDLPPRFQKDPAAAVPSQTAAATGGTAPNGVSAQDLMMWQMMMSSMGSQGTGGAAGMNPWMMMGMPGMEGGQMDPSAMSTMMMNQMMSDFNFNGDDRDR